MNKENETGPRQNPSIDAVFEQRDLTQDARWNRSPYSALPIDDHGVNTSSESVQMREDLQETGQRVMAYYKLGPKIPELLQMLYPNDWVAEFAEFLVELGFEKDEIIAGLREEGVSFLVKRQKLDILHIARDLFGRYVRSRFEQDPEGFLNEVRQMPDSRVVQYKIDRIFMDSTRDAPEGFTGLLGDIDGISHHVPIVDLIEVVNGKLNRNIQLSFPAISLVYFGLTPYTNSFIVFKPIVDPVD